MVKPFKLDNLEKVSRHEVELVRALYEFLPATDVRDRLNVSIRKTLMKHLGQDIRYYVSSVEKKDFDEFVYHLPECPVMMVMGLTPIDKKAVVQIDNNIANIVINKLLGGDVSVPSEIKPLTDTEQGVLQYLIMQVLSRIHALAGAESRVHFRFEKFLFDPEKLLKLARPKEGVCILTIEITIFDQAGFVRLAFPYSFLEEIMRLPAGRANSKKEKDYFLSQLKRWGFVKTSVWAEAGNVLVSPIEIKDLESGDVVLFDDTRLELAGNKISGELLVHFGMGEGGANSKLVKVGSKTIGCKLGNIVK